MQIRPEQLEAQLARELKALYTIHGDEPLLAQEAGDAIRAAARGESFLQPSITAKVLAEFNRLEDRAPVKPMADLVEPLSDSELEILQQVAVGDSNKEIAARLFITEGTVKNHVTNILGKLGVRDRTQAALRAREMGLI